MNHPKRILIVEDNAQTAEYLAELLRARGYYTEWAFDREEVFNKLDEIEQRLAEASLIRPCTVG